MADDVAVESAKEMLYFAHDTDMRHDPKCVRLRLILGMEAYGRLNILFECLGGYYTHIIPFSTDLDKRVLAAELECSMREAERFCAACAECGLINAELWEQGKISSDRMQRNAFTKATKSVAGRSGGRKKKSA